MPYETIDGIAILVNGVAVAARVGLRSPNFEKTRPDLPNSAAPRFQVAIDAPLRTGAYPIVLDVAGVRHAIGRMSVVTAASEPP